jgi:Domain of unknown function (DUF6268)
MRTYAWMAWLILCAGAGTALGQQPNARSRDPFLNYSFSEVADDALENSWPGGEPVRPVSSSSIQNPDIPQMDLEPMQRDPGQGPPTQNEDELSFQYPLDQGDYEPPVAVPEQPSRTWVPPVLHKPEEPETPHAGYWVRLKTAKTAITQVGSGGTFGITTLQVRPTFEFPKAPGVFVTPNVGWHFLAGPSTTDLPGYLYDVSLDVAMYRPVGEQWLFEVAIMPGIYTDGNNTTSDAIRIQGRVFGYYTMKSGKQLVLGFVYLDRQDVPVLPTFGVIMQPREDLRYELLFPKPRLAWRQYVNSNWEQWVYVTGELGGGSWGVRRTTGLNDIATYRDLRLVLGVERKQATGRSMYVEGGYVFGRRLEFLSNIGNVTFDETAFLRIGGSF